MQRSFVVLVLGVFCGICSSCDPARQLQVKNGFDEPIRVEVNGVGESDYLEPGWETSVQTIGPAPDASITVTFPRSPEKPPKTWIIKLLARGVNKQTLPP